MSKILIIALIAFLSSLVLFQIAYCMPALDAIHQLEQPDGTTFSAKLWGDETGHGWETLDGYTIVNDPATRAWHYARLDHSAKTLMTAGIVGTP